MTKVNLKSLWFLLRASMLWPLFLLNQLSAMSLEIGKRAWTGAAAMILFRDILSHGGAGRTKTQTQDSHTYGMPSLTLPSLSPTNKEEEAEIIDPRKKFNYPQLPSEFAIDEFVCVLYTDTTGVELNGFGTIKNVLEEQYIIKLVDRPGNWILAYPQAVVKSSRG